MNIKAFIAKGPHITHTLGLGHYAFGLNVLDALTDPSVYLPDSILYTKRPFDAEFAALIHHYSIHDKINTFRKPGMYYLSDAEARVHYDNNYYRIEANGKTLANVAKLCERILAGDIAPVRSHDGVQVVSTVASVREAFHRLIDALALAYSQWRPRLKG